MKSSSFLKFSFSHLQFVLEFKNMKISSHLTLFNSFFFKCTLICVHAHIRRYQVPLAAAVRQVCGFGWAAVACAALASLC